VRLATKAGDNFRQGRALLNLADSLAATDAGAAEEAARTAVEHLRRTGARDYVAFALGNQVQALMMLGDWAVAGNELSQAMESDGSVEILPCYRGWLLAMQGDAATAESEVARLRNMRASEAPQDQAAVLLVQAFSAAARRQPENALRRAQAVLDHVTAIGVGHECIRWAWPLAARAAHELGNMAASHELLALLDGYPPGYVAPMLWAERDLVRARLTDGDVDQAAKASFAAAVTGLRDMSTPYHLAHGLLDHAQYLGGQADGEAAEQAIAEARGIAERLGCQPLLDRAAGITPARPHSRA
jgi:hypothetical protein